MEPWTVCARWCVGTLVAVVVAGCPAAPPEPAPPPSSPETQPAEPAPVGTEPDPGAANPPQTASLAPDGAACNRGADCASEICEGQGCGEGAGACMPRDRMCTTDLVPYCGCDGVTFRSSSGCPGRLYSARGECPAAEK